VFLLYIDEDALHRGAVAAFRSAGFDCLTVNEAGMSGRTDEDQLVFAAARGRVIFTKNTADFQQLNGNGCGLDVTTLESPC